MKLIISILLATNISFADDKQFIKSSQFSNWPFKDSEYTLGCLEREGRKMVYIMNIDDIYGINGAARGFGKKLLGWKDGESQLKKGKLLTSIQQFIDKGLQLCK